MYTCTLFFSLPTMFITECVLVYMEPERSAAIINWAGANFKTAVFINYEQVSNIDIKISSVFRVLLVIFKLLGMKRVHLP